LEWYYSLPPNSVDSFETLCTQFIARIIDSKPMVTSSVPLQHVMQGDFKSLWQYMTRFSKAMLQITNLHLTVAMHSLQVRLKPSPFLNTLYANPSENMDSLKVRAARYMSIE